MEWNSAQEIKGPETDRALTLNVCNAESRAGTTDITQSVRRGLINRVDECTHLRALDGEAQRDDRQ